MTTRVLDVGRAEVAAAVSPDDTTVPARWTAEGVTLDAGDTTPTPPYVSAQEPCGDPRGAAVVLGVDSRGQAVTAFAPCGDAACGWCRGCTAPLAVSTATVRRWPNGLGESLAGRATRPATEEEGAVHARVAAAAGY